MATLVKGVSALEEMREKAVNAGKSVNEAFGEVESKGKVATDSIKITTQKL